MIGQGTNHPAAVEREEDSMRGVRVQRFSDILTVEERVSSQVKSSLDWFLGEDQIQLDR